MLLHYAVLIFFFNDTATTEIYTLSLHDALPIYDPETDIIEHYVISNIQGKFIILDSLDDNQYDSIENLISKSPEFDKYYFFQEERIKKLEYKSLYKHIYNNILDRYLQVSRI